MRARPCRIQTGRADSWHDELSEYLIADEPRSMGGNNSNTNPSPFKMCLGLHSRMQKVSIRRPTPSAQIQREPRRTRAQFNKETKEHQSTSNVEAPKWNIELNEASLDDLLSLEPVRYGSASKPTRESMRNTSDPVSNEAADAAIYDGSAAKAVVDAGTAIDQDKNIAANSEALGQQPEDKLELTFESVHEMLDNGIFRKHHLFESLDDDDKKGTKKQHKAAPKLLELPAANATAAIPSSSATAATAARTRSRNTRFMSCGTKTHTHNVMLRKRERDAIQQAELCSRRSSEQLLLNLQRANQKPALRSLSPARRLQTPMIRERPRDTKEQQQKQQQHKHGWESNLQTEKYKTGRKWRSSSPETRARDLFLQNQVASEPASPSRVMNEQESEESSDEDVDKSPPRAHSLLSESLRKLVRDEVVLHEECDQDEEKERERLESVASNITDGDNSTAGPNAWKQTRTRARELRLEVLRAIREELDMMRIKHKQEQDDICESIVDLQEQCDREQSYLPRLRKGAQHYSFSGTQSRGIQQPPMITGPHSARRSKHLRFQASERRSNSNIEQEPTRKQKPRTLQDVLFRVRLLRNLICRHLAQLFLRTLSYQVALRRRRLSLVMRFERRRLPLLHRLCFSVWQEELAHTHASEEHMWKCVAPIQHRRCHRQKKRIVCHWYWLMQSSRRHRCLNDIATRYYAASFFYEWQNLFHRMQYLRSALLRAVDPPNAAAAAAPSVEALDRTSMRSAFSLSNGPILSFKKRCRQEACSYELRSCTEEATELQEAHACNRTASAADADASSANRGEDEGRSTRRRPAIESMMELAAQLHLRRLRLQCVRKWRHSLFLLRRAEHMQDLYRCSIFRRSMQQWLYAVTRARRLRRYCRLRGQQLRLVRHWQLWCGFVALQQRRSRQASLRYRLVVLRYRWHCWSVFQHQHAVQRRLLLLLCTNHRRNHLRVGLHRWIVAISRRVRLRRMFQVLRSCQLARLARPLLRSWHQKTRHQAILQRVLDRAARLWRHRLRHEADKSHSDVAPDREHALDEFSKLWRRFTRWHNFVSRQKRWRRDRVERETAELFDHIRRRVHCLSQWRGAVSSRWRLRDIMRSWANQARTSSQAKDRFVLKWRYLLPLKKAFKALEVHSWAGSLTTS